MMNKADILASASQLRERVSIEGTDWEPEVRALFDAEFAKAQSVLMGNQSIATSPGEADAPDQVVLNIGQLMEGEFEARCHVVAMAITDDDWSIDEVKRIPYPGAVKTISEKVLRLGKHDLYEGLEAEARRDLAQFRDEPGRHRHGADASGGSSAGEEPAGDDNSAATIPGDGAAEAAS